MRFLCSKWRSWKGNSHSMADSNGVKQRLTMVHADGAAIKSYADGAVIKSYADGAAIKSYHY